MITTLSFASLIIYPLNAVLLVDDFSGDLSITEADYPEGWTDGCHPDDYKFIKTPLPSDFFMNPMRHHHRLWFRISFKFSETKYLPMSFVIDTGAPSSLYLSPR
jgi:hypothetical protein